MLTLYSGLTSFYVTTPAMVVNCINVTIYAKDVASLIYHVIFKTINGYSITAHFCST